MTFAAALIVGVAAGNPAATILWRATVVMVLAWLVGRVIGAIAQSTVDDYLETYRKAHPIPSNQNGRSEPGAAEEEPAGDTA